MVVNTGPNSSRCLATLPVLSGSIPVNAKESWERRIFCASCTWKYQAQLSNTSRLTHSNSSALNLLLAFAISLKHKLRFEPDVAYEDLAGLVGYLDTFAREAHDHNVVSPPPKSTLKAAGEYLGVSWAESNPRKLIKRAKKPLGHLPLEILHHLSAYVDTIVDNGTLKSALHQGQASKFYMRLCIVCD